MSRGAGSIEGAAGATGRSGEPPLRAWWTARPGPKAPARERLAWFLERATVATLFLFALAAPHSIAVSQGAWIAGMVFWGARMVAERRWRVRRTPVDVAMAVFVAWTLLSVATSVVPAYSAGRLRSVSLFLIMYLFASNVPTLRAAWTISLVLALSALGNLWWTYYARYEGRGVKIVAMDPRSPLRKWALQPGDTLLAADNVRVGSLDDVNRAFDRGEPREALVLHFARGEWEGDTSHRRKPVRRAGTDATRLGVTVEPGRDWRAEGFFGHPVTYAETLQMLGALAAGWALAAFRRPRWAVGMAALAALVAGGIVMTGTRASLLTFVIACCAMAGLRGVGRRVGTALVLGAVVVLAVGTAVRLRERNVGWLDMTDQSTTWRLTVWREGLGLLAEHPLLGIGPDAAHEKWQEWGLFREGDQQLPPGHWHSTPVQIAVDRGLPALFAWLALVGGFLLSIGRLVRRLAREEARGGDWRATAAALGAWGAVVGFLASSIVHFNWGDGEVVEMAWALMGIAFAVWRLTPARAAGDAARPQGEGALGAGTPAACAPGPDVAPPVATASAALRIS